MIDWGLLETRIKKHDYTYEMSDDHRWWRAGCADEDAVRLLIKEALVEDKKRIIAIIKKYAHKYGTNFMEGLE